MTTVALIVAAGRGSRATRAGEPPKQYASLGGATVLARTVAAFAGLDAIDSVQVVIHADDFDLYRAAMPSDTAKLRAPVAGGATRQASVLAGLEALAAAGHGDATRVLVHDAARPFVSAVTILAVIAALDSTPAALAAVPLSDTLKRATADGHVAETVPRAGLWRAQTPQGFHLARILDAHRRAAAAGLSDFTDDAAIAEWAGLAVALVEDRASNSKITTLADLETAERTMTADTRAPLLEPRAGTGFDVHRFAAGDHVWLGGVRIPHTHALEGHSDADVALHALTDAILGALGDGDIGQHFPPSDPKWKGAASHIFLADAARRVAERGGRIANVDITLLCEAPKIGPHRADMQRAIAAILGIEPARVGVKATTTEGLGFTGRREGIAAMASAMLLLP